MIRRVLLLLVLSAMLGAGAVYYFLQQPYGQFPEPKYVEFPRGSSARAMARRLEREGVIRYGWEFLLVHSLRRGATLQAGEYRFTAPATVQQVFDRIARGDVYYVELRVPEGSNLFDIAALVEESGVIKAKDFLAAASSPRLIHDFSPRSPSLEGFLFPATYRLTRHTTAQSLCQEMVGQFRRVWTELKGQTRRQDADVHEVVTMASLVEKEAAIPSDRPLIASVFWNRLRRHMTLDCDPTTIYAALLEDRYRGTIYRSDLASKNLYNTYQHAGLPPGPIANAGRESLKAALAPAASEYLFFVARPDRSRGHVFSENLEKHNRAVQEYRRGSAKPKV